MAHESRSDERRGGDTYDGIIEHNLCASETGRGRLVPRGLG